MTSRLRNQLTCPRGAIVSWYAYSESGAAVPAGAPALRWAEEPALSATHGQHRPADIELQREGAAGFPAGHGLERVIDLARRTAVVKNAQTAAKRPDEKVAFDKTRATRPSRC